ncbi:MAG TPA: hypothetical protein VHC22_14310 [Pirellulales bacterium]|nr:hypothetical protein [Pirellulales bacterium]
MTECLSKFEAKELVGLVAVIGGLLWVHAAIVGGIIAKCVCVCHAREIAFKQDLIARGLSAEEIQAVMQRPPRRS